MTIVWVLQVARVETQVGNQIKGSDLSYLQQHARRSCRKLHFAVFVSPKKLIKSLFVDVTGSVISAELLLLATTLLLGLLAGFVAIRDAAVSELSDVAGAFQDINQSYTTNGVAGNSSASAGYQYCLLYTSDAADE